MGGAADQPEQQASRRAVSPPAGAAGDGLGASLREIARWIATALDAGCAICLHDGGADGARLVAAERLALPDEALLALLRPPAPAGDEAARNRVGNCGPLRRDTLALPGAGTCERLYRPLGTADGPLGVLAVVRPVVQGPFTAAHAALFATLAEGTALALDAVRHQATTRRSQEERSAQLALTVATQRAELALHARAEREAAQLLAQVRAAETRFRDLVESAPDGVLIVDESGRITSLNHQAEVLFGYRRAELVGQAVEILLPERFRARHVALRVGYSADPHTRPMGIGLELYGRRRDGGELPIEISLSPLHVAGDAPLIIATVRDVTERRRAARQLRETAAQLARQKEELARSNAELEQFAYVASHDLQEPLRMVASYTQLLARRYRGRLDADADEFIGYAVDGADRMRQLIQDLLAYSRVGTRGQDVQLVPCDALIDAIGADLGAAIAETGATLIRDAPLPMVPGDPTQLRQLFQNLIGNALKYRRPATPPAIQIGAVREGATWHFTVRDNGIGIAPEYAERIFEIFQRFHTQGEYPGTGIGLAIARKIAERHGGRIWVESEPGRGSTFHLILPASGQEGEGGDAHGA